MNPPSEYDQVRRLADGIGDRSIRALFDRFVDICLNIHDEIRVDATSVEIRFFFRDEFLLRVVPYRDLFHVQVGEIAEWETRVRTEPGFLETVDRTLDRFLTLCATSPR